MTHLLFHNHFLGDAEGFMKFREFSCYLGPGAFELSGCSVSRNKSCSGDGVGY